MATFPKEIAEFMAKYKVGANDVWPVPGGKSYAVKHKALERIAADVGIKFDRPAILEGNGEKKYAAMVVFAKLGDREEWTIGEAAPGNCKNAYTWAMAEKRAKDRCILKLLQVHGDLYSSEEIEPRPNPHTNKPEDFYPPVEHDEHGEVIDNIPSGDPSIATLSKSIARPDYANALAEMRATKSINELQAWGERNKNRVASYPTDWAEMLRGQFAEHRDDLRGQNGRA